MNDNRSLHDELADEARHLPLTSTGIEVILETAGRRRRRRNVTAIGSVLAVTAVTVAGIQQLSRVDEAEVALSPPETIVPNATTTTIDSGAVTDTTLYGRYPQSGMDLSSAVPAVASAPVMTWTVVDADSPQALAVRYGGVDQRYALATEPGGEGPARRSLYEQVDGDWVQVAANVLPDGLAKATVSGDAIYAVGTAPASAGEAPGAVGRFDVTTRSWELLPLPEEARPYRSDKVMSSADMSIAPIDGGALVVINRGGGYVDYQAVDALGYGGSGYNWIEGQLEVMTNCDQVAIDQAVNGFETGQTAITVAPDAVRDPYQQAMADFCDVRYLTADDLGLSAADVAELDRTPGIFIYRYDGTTLTPVDSPLAAGSGVSLQGNVLTGYTSDGAYAWLVQPDGSFQQIFADLGSLDGSWIREYDGVVAMAANGIVVTGTPGGPSSLVDLSAIVTDDTMQNPTTWINGVASNGAATVAVAFINYQRAGTTAGPTTIQGTTYDLVIDPNNGVTVVDRATGRTLADGFQLATEPGALRLVARPGDDLVYSDPTSTTIVPGTVPATTSVDGAWPDVTSPGFDSGTGEVIDQFDVDWQTLAPWAQAQTTKIVSSIDGRSYAAESFTGLVGAGPDEHAEAFSGDIVDGRFIISGRVWSVPGEYGRSVILIGTPNG